ncbi:transposase family protein [Mesorhizobium sp.]|uniref:transposase family protein n=1 Tax=Mesorhizobium sp. TaxID=1871066 RepID=UPI0039C915EE
MERRAGSTKLAPAGFVVEHAEIDTDCVFLDVRATAVSETCPCCGISSLRIQSRYLRQAADLPIAGRRVFLRVTVRRFWCDAVLCRRRICRAIWRRYSGSVISVANTQACPCRSSDRRT